MSEAISELEQQEYYAQLAKKTSESLAYFYCCVKYDVPFARDCVPRDEGRDKWLSYLDNLHIKKLDASKSGERYGFLDGLTDITKIFGEGLKDGEFTKAVYAEKNAQSAKAGTVRQRKDWGTGNDEHPYTNEDYAEFDRIYTVLASDLGGEDALSAKQQLILRNVSKWTKQMNDASDAGKFDAARKLSAIIQENLASDNLRKRDAKPVEEIRIDGITERLEKAGLMKNGKPVEPDTAFELLFHRRPKYSYTKDAAEQMLLAIINTSRMNDSLPEFSTLPDSARIKDDLHEFAEEPNEMEKTAYEGFGYVKMPPVKEK